MIRVLLLAENWKPRIGGIERYLEGIVDALRVQKFEVEIVSPATKRFFWPLIKPAWLPLFISLWKKAKRKEFEVLLCGKALFEGLVGYYLKKYLGIPYLVFTYGMEIRRWQGQKKEKIKMKKVLMNADKVVYINEVAKKQLVELGVREEQLVKVQPGIEPAAANTSEVIPAGRRYILSVGRLIPRKGFDTLIEAFEKLDQTQFGDVELWIVGEGPILASLTRASKGKRVRFLGQVSDKELQKLYAGAEIFALTPRKIEGDYEGFGIVYLEAARYGVPAVGTRTGGVPEAVVHDKTGLLAEPNNPEAAAIAFMQLLANPELRGRLGRQARLRVQEEFTWPKRIRPLTQALKAIRE